MRQFGFAGILVGLLSMTAVGQEAVTIKVGKPVAGDRIKTTKNDKMTSKVNFTVNGKADSKDDVESKLIVYTDKIITAALETGKPVKLKRTYEKYEVVKGGKEQAGPPLNTPILIEKKGGKYAVSSDKELDAGFTTRLAAEFDRENGGMGIDRLLPTKPVKAGDTWKVDLSKLPGFTGDAMSIGCNRSPAFGEIAIAAGLMASGSDKTTFLADNVGNHTHTFPNQEGRDS